MSNPANTTDQNLLPVQAYFDVEGDFQTFIGQGKPFYANVSPDQSGLNITNSTINSSTIGATTPSTGVFTNILSTTGQVTTAPLLNIDIANKAYVDAIAQGLAPKQACKVATTADITLSGLQTLDTTYTTLAGDRVLVKNQLNSAQNGIYIASSTAWTRSVDMDVWSEVPGAYTVILNGQTQGSTSWVTTAADTGTINVTSMPWVQFSGISTYTAGTGLTLSANQFSITNTGVTAASYGAASKTLTLAINAQGQITSASAGDIAIAASQITSGTLDVVRGGTGQSSYTDGQLLIGNTSGNTLTKSTLTAGTGVSIANGNGSITITNSAPDQIVSLTAGTGISTSGTYPDFTITNTAPDQIVSLTGAGTTTVTGTYPSFTITSTSATGTVFGPTSSTDNAIVRFDSTTGKLIQNSGVIIDDNDNVFNPRSVSFSGAIPAAPSPGTLWFDSSTDTLNLQQNAITQQIGEELFVYGKASAAISGNTILQAIYKTGTVGASGVIQFAPTIAGITDTGAIVGVGTEDIAHNGFGRITNFGIVHGINTSGSTYGETWVDGQDIWYNPTTGGLTKTKPSAPNQKFQIGTVINAGSGGSGSFQVLLQPGSVLGGTDSNVQLGTLANNDVLVYDSSLQYWKNLPSSSVPAGTAVNLAGGSTGTIAYQSAPNTTAFTAAGSSGQVLGANAGGIPTWVTPVSYATVTDDTTTNGTRYPLFANQTTGNLTTEYTSSTKYQFNPSTGVLTATQFSGSGAGLTSLPAGQLSGTIPSGVLGNSSLYIGTTSIALNRGSGSQTLTGTSIDGNAATATSATSATNATNVAVTDDTTTNSTYYLAVMSASTGNVGVKVSSTKLQYNPSTGVLNATGGISGGTF
jgi:hypothetical protein